MKPFPLLVLAVSLLFAPAASAQDILSRIQASLAEIQTLSADFEQVRESPMLSSKLISKGRVWLGDGGKVRWEYSSPARRVSVSDGSRFMKLSPSDFDIKATDLSGGVGEVAYILDLNPLRRDMKAMFRTVRLSFGKDLGLLRIELLQDSGDRTLITFSSTKYNLPLDPALFASPN